MTKAKLDKANAKFIGRDHTDTFALDRKTDATLAKALAIIEKELANPSKVHGHTEITFTRKGNRQPETMSFAGNLGGLGALSALLDTGIELAEERITTKFVQPPL